MVFPSWAQVRKRTGASAQTQGRAKRRGATAQMCCSFWLLPVKFALYTNGAVRQVHTDAFYSIPVITSQYAKYLASLLENMLKGETIRH